MATSSQSKTLSHRDLRDLVQERLNDAEALLAAGRYDAAAYMCGYVLEMALKACICRRLREREYPESALEGKFKTHKLNASCCSPA
jgi:HEPN domain-containing protein